jgi:hypothetical protein
MGWKTSTIIITPRPDLPVESLLNSLGLTDLKSIDDEPFEIALNPKGSNVYIGSYKDSLIISVPDIPASFLTENLSYAEKILIRECPEAEICAIILHSTVNLWGYSIIKNGQKIRARAGASDDGTFLEYGTPLIEEEALLSKSTIDDHGNRIYLLDEFPEEPFTEDQVGENFVFEICSRYFGTPLDSADDLLFETVLTGYRFSKNTKPNRDSSSKEVQLKNKPWWKFW